MHELSVVMSCRLLLNLLCNYIATFLEYIRKLGLFYTLLFQESNAPLKVALDDRPHSFYRVQLWSIGRHVPQVDTLLSCHFNHLGCSVSSGIV